MRKTNVPTRWDQSWLSDFEDVFNPLFAQPFSFKDKDCPYDISESDEFYRLTLDVPGIDPKHIQIKTQENNIYISATENKENKTKRHRYNLNTSFSLPHHIDLSQIEANVENGVLDIILPKKKTSQLKKIPVQSHPSHGFLEKIKKQFTQNSH